MVNKVFFWTGFGIAVRFWQLGIEKRPFFYRSGLWAYPFFGAIGGTFGYWLQGTHAKQMAILQERRERLIEKRKRRAEREARFAAEEGAGGVAAGGTVQG